MDIVTRHETNSAKETFEIGKRIGESATPGMVYTLVGDLELPKGLELRGLSAARLLLFCRFMTREGFLFTTSMCIVSVMSARWTRSDTRTTSTGTESALSSGRTS